MFLSSEFLHSHMLRKHRDEDRLISQRKTEEISDELKEKVDSDMVKKEFNELQNRLLTTQQELETEKEATRELTEQVTILTERLNTFENVLNLKDLSKSVDQETSERTPLPAALDSVKAAVKDELGAQKTLIDDLKSQLIYKEEENGRLIKSLLEEQTSRFEEQILLLKKSFEEDFLAKTITQAANQEAIEDVIKDFEDKPQTHDSSEYKHESPATAPILTDQPETPPVPRPRTRKRSLEKNNIKTRESTGTPDDSLTTYESQDEESKHDVLQEYNKKLSAFKVDENTLDKVRFRAIRRSREDLNKQYPNFTRKRDALSERINAQASSILKNHFRSRSRSGTVLNTQPPKNQLESPKPVFHNKTLMAKIAQSLKAAGTFLKRPKKKPWSSTLSLPITSGSTIDLVVPAPKQPTSSRTQGSSRARRRATQNLYDESPLKSSPTVTANQKPRVERAWSDSDLSSIGNHLDTTSREEKENQKEPQFPSKFKSFKELKSKSVRKKVSAASHTLEAEENKVSDAEEQSRSPLLGGAVKEMDKGNLKIASDLSPQRDGSRKRNTKARKSIVFKEEHSSLSEEKSYEALSPVISTEKYAQEKAAIQSRIEELTKSIEEQLNSRSSYAPAGGVSILRRTDQLTRTTMYDNASDS